LLSKIHLVKRSNVRPWRSIAINTTDQDWVAQTSIKLIVN